MGSPCSTMRRQVSLPFLLSFLTLSWSSSIRLKRQLNFGPQKSTENKQRPTNKVFFGLPNPFGSNIGGSTGSTYSCATGGDPGDTVTAPRLGRVCNCATSVEFGGDCKGRGQGDRFFGCGCGGPGNGIFAFSKRKRRQTGFGGEEAGFGGEQTGFGGEQETQERIFNLR